MTEKVSLRRQALLGIGSLCLPHIQLEIDLAFEPREEPSGLGDVETLLPFPLSHGLSMVLSTLVVRHGGGDVFVAGHVSNLRKGNLCIV